MSMPKLFIGSSKENIKVARLMEKRLKSVAEVKVWDSVFNLSQSYLEDLLEFLRVYDFAVLIWAQDDVTSPSKSRRPEKDPSAKSKADSKPSPRDNVIFEAGLFMGRFGRERVFIVHDRSVELKIPSDLAGITLAPYDGSRMKGDHPEAAVSSACRRISNAVKKQLTNEVKKQQRFLNIVGKWTSRYVQSEESEHAYLTEKTVEIKLQRGGVSIESIINPKNDYYNAHGHIVHEKHITGEWWSTRGSGRGKGLFLLTMNPPVNVMYGYDTDTDESGAVVFKTWVLAKQDGSDEAEINKRLRWAEKQLSDKTFGPAPPAA